jgi:hypothetical protein
MIRTITSLFALALGFGAMPLPAAEPTVRSLRTQGRGDTTYFEVRLDMPADFWPPAYATTRGWWTERGRDLVRTPRLVPQDDKTAAVYWFPGQTSFVGKLTGGAKARGKAEFQFLYATRAEAKLEKDLPEILAKFLHATAWQEIPLTLDFAKAVKLDAQRQPRPRRAEEPFSFDDLELVWATAQAEHFAIHEALSPEFGFYGFAREATRRKYGVQSPKWIAQRWADRERIYREAYDVTTGAAAITESLQLHRMREGRPAAAPRTIDVNTVQGITIAEHPWEKMMAGQKPSPEPLAKLVPHDNYYLHFKNIAKLMELGELLEQWGGGFGSFYELNSRDAQVRQKYERQLCIRSTWLGKTLGPLVIRSLAITGSDPYLREGADLAVLFQVPNRALFLGAMQQFISEARKEHGKELREDKYEVSGVAVETFTTPHREVSLHRATLDDVVVYANSPVGMRRIIEAHQGKAKSLDESLDYQYMRTVFRLEDPLEDGFVFLSDAFIRKLVGPATRIKERRRLEALTSLGMATNAALFHAWETGKLPDHDGLLNSNVLKLTELEAPEGKPVVWDEGRKLAVSDAYNTLHFATPLIELPIDRVTQGEARDYDEFRQRYLGLWRQFFDPIGIRVKLTPEQLRVEAYILPLVASGKYSFLRDFSGGAPVGFDMARVTPATALQWFAKFGGRNLGVDGIGDQVSLRLDDDAVFDKWLDYYLRRQRREPDDRMTFAEEGRLLLQMPIALSVKIADEPAFDRELAKFAMMLQNFVGKYDERNLNYKGVPIGHLTFRDGTSLVNEVNRDLQPGEKKFLPQLFHAKLDGFWHVSFREEPIKAAIDQSHRRANKAPDDKQVVKANSVFYIAPSALVHAKHALGVYQEWETHCRSVANGPAWRVLFKAGVLPPNANKEDLHEAALHWFGYIPVSPDRRPYVYLPKFDEVENIWHGSPRHPQMRGGFDPHAPLAQLLEQIRTIRADFRFREDGINTVVTIERGK